MKIKVGKFLIESLDDKVIQILLKKRNKIIWEGNISDIEITFYLPEKTISRVPSMILVLPVEHSPINIVNRHDNGEIKNLYEYLVSHGSVENLHSIFTAGAVSHSTIRKETEINKAKLREKRVIEKENKKEEAKKERAIKRQIRAEKAKIDLANRRRRAGCKEMKEEKYTCTVCHTVWYSNDMDKIKNIHNALTLSNYSVNHMKDISRCPKCGSRASSHKTVTYWVDKKGNCVDREE